MLRRRQDGCLSRIPGVADRFRRSFGVAAGTECRPVWYRTASTGAAILKPARMRFEVRLSHPRPLQEVDRGTVHCPESLKIQRRDRMAGPRPSLGW